MSDIYKILAKHFSDEASDEENKAALDFKSKHEKEYLALKLFWSKKDTAGYEYDTKKAWRKIEQHAPKTRVISMHSMYRKIASIAAVFLIGALITLFVLKDNYTNNSNIELVANEVDQKVILPDGTIVFLNDNSKISYPTSFEANKRVVSLEGEAFFEVMRDTIRPFLIHTPHSDIEVLGTSFNVNTENMQTEVAVRTGKVKVLSLLLNKSVILLPHDMAIVNNHDIQTKQVDNENYMAWKTGHFTFNETPVAEVIKELNTFYSNQIVLHGTGINCHLTADFKQRELTEVVEIISLTCNLKIKEKNGIYELQ